MFRECPSWQPPLWEQNAPSPGAGVPRRPARRCSGAVPGRCGGPSAFTWRSRQETQVFAFSGDRSGSLGTCSDTRSGGSQTSERLMRGRARLSRDAPWPQDSDPGPSRGMGQPPPPPPEPVGSEARVGILTVSRAAEGLGRPHCFLIYPLKIIPSRKFWAVHALFSR